MKSVREILSSYKIFNGIRLENLMILNSVWKEEMKEFSDYCEIDSIDKRALVLRVKNSVIKNELFMRKDEILKKINKHFKSPFIKDIKLI
jgi:hypothetical protein